jgi:hypothetical protein
MAELSALIGAENAAAARDVYAAVNAHARADERLKARLSMHTDRLWVLPLWHTLLGASCTAYASCMVHAVLCCVLHVACCALHAGAMLCDVVRCCALHVAWRLAQCCLLHADGVRRTERAQSAVPRALVVRRTAARAHRRRRPGRTPVRARRVSACPRRVAARARARARASKRLCVSLPTRAPPCVGACVCAAPFTVRARACVQVSAGSCRACACLAHTERRQACVCACAPRDAAATVCLCEGPSS